MNKAIQVLVILFSITIMWTSCSKDEDPEEMEMEMEIQERGAYTDGILVSNEGPFGNGTGTVTHISEDLSVTSESIFNAVNGQDLGNVVQSIGFNGTDAYIVANVSNTITVVDRNTFLSKATITDGLSNPRYFISVNNKGYVSNWGDTADETDDYIAIIDLNTSTVSGTIPVELGPELMVSNDNTLYVAQQGAFGQNNKVTVINTATDEIEAVIGVGDVPNSMVFDADENLWVLGGGKPSFTGSETAGSLSKINTETNQLNNSFEFDVTEHPSQLNIDNTTLYYYLAGSVYELPVSGDALPTETTIDDVNFYEMVVNNGLLYGTDAKDFASNGDLNIYSLNTKALLNTISVGIIPGGIYFN